MFHSALSLDQILKTERFTAYISKRPQNWTGAYGLNPDIEDFELNGADEMFPKR
jgi:hypothetical protein